MNPNDRKQRRRALTRCFFFHNRTAAFLAMSAVILNIPLNLAVAWQMQQLIDIAAGSPSAFTLPQISAALALSFAVMAAIMALGSYARPLFIERAVRQYRITPLNSSPGKVQPLFIPRIPPLIFRP